MEIQKVLNKSKNNISTSKQDHLRMNIAQDQTIILGIQIFLDHRSLSLIDQTNLNDTGRVIIGHRYSKSTFGANKSTNRN